MHGGVRGAGKFLSCFGVFGEEEEEDESRGGGGGAGLWEVVVLVWGCWWVVLVGGVESEKGPLEGLLRC